MKKEVEVKVTNFAILDGKLFVELKINIAGIKQRRVIIDWYNLTDARKRFDENVK